MHFEGKADGYRQAMNCEADEVRRLRDRACGQSICQLTENRDPYQYQFFCGVAAAATEVIGLHVTSD